MAKRAHRKEKSEKPGARPGLKRLVRSKTFRFALIYLSLFTASVLVVLMVAYWSATAAVTRQIDTTIETQVRALSEQFQQRGVGGLMQAIMRRSKSEDGAHGLYLLTDQSYQPIAGNLSHWPNVPIDEDGWINFRLELPSNEEEEVNYARARVFDLGEQYHLLVGHDIQERTRLAQMIRESLSWSLAVVVTVSLVGGILMTRVILARIDAVNDAAMEIMAGSMDRRVPVRGTDDEFDRLATNLNAMLDQISSLVESVKAVSDNVAHDLRSPLSRLRSRLEVTLMERQDAESYRQALEQAIAEVDSVLGTFSALLTIAEAESGRSRPSFTAIDLKEVADDVHDLYAPVAEEQGLQLTTWPGEADLTGNRELLFQAVANLVDNAIKFSPPGGEIELSVEKLSGYVRIIVSDQGPGVPASERARVVERFYRLDASRSTPGSGLGLSLVAAVARLHGGTLELQDNMPGLRAVLELPAE